MQFFDIDKCGLVFSPRFKPWARRCAYLILVLLFIVCCRNEASVNNDSEAKPQYSVGTDPKHVFYLHGKIIEQQGKEAVSPEFGRYEFDSIVSTLEKQGWKVYADVRPQDVDFEEYCQKVSHQVDSLIEKVKCQPENIAIIGASKGAVMAMRVSDLNQYPINYVLLGANSDYIEENYDWYMKGRILGIYEKSDTIADKDYQFWIDRSKEAKEFKQLEINTGLNHGFIYTPLKEWVEPTVEWVELKN